MISNSEYISLFMTRSLEKSVDDLVLSDKNFVVPKQKVHDYIERVLSIPYIDFLDYVKIHQGVIKDEQLTQSSSFAACSTQMCKVLEWHGNPGMQFVEIGQLFPQYVRQRNEMAFRKYGENQIKTSAQLGLVFEYYGYWYLTCVGYVFNELECQQQLSLLARTILRIPLYSDIIIKLMNNDVNITMYMDNLADSTKGRRSGSILRMINLCLEECDRNSIKYYDIYYPIYISRTKTLKIEKRSGKYITKGTKAIELRLIPQTSLLKNVEEDKEVRVLVHNMMELYEGTTIISIVVECQKQFQERYFSMSSNDWIHLIGDYTRKLINKPNLQNDEVFRFIMTG